VFEAPLKTPATTAGHKIRDHCGRSSLLLSVRPCESISVGDGELVHRLAPLPGGSTSVRRDVLQRQLDQLGCRTVLGQHRLAARPIAVIVRVLRLLSAGHVSEVVGELRPQAALNQGLLKRLGCGIYRIRAHRPFDDLVDQLRGNARQGGIGRRVLLLA
jgi:hypothetical protein